MICDMIVLGILVCGIKQEIDLYSVLKTFVY